METAFQYSVHPASWHDDRAALQDLRRRVFIIEQHVPESLEWDEADAACQHVLAFDTQLRPVGTGRLLPDGHIGRMAVLREWRGRGVGAAMLDFLIACAWRQGHAAVHLNAQTHALGFYACRGFVAHGDEFMDAGIPHRRMTLSR